MVPGSGDIPHAQTLETSHVRVMYQTFSMYGPSLSIMGYLLIAEQHSSPKEGVLSAVIQGTQGLKVLSLNVNEVDAHVK